MTESAPLSYPLTDIQRRVFSAEAMTKPGTYNVTEHAVIKGAIDPEALALCLFEIIQDSYVYSQRVVWPSVGEPQAFAGAPPVVHCTKVQEKSYAKAVQDALSHHEEVTFDLTQGPFVHASCLCNMVDRADIIFTAHHSVHDGRSADILFSRLSIAYRDAIEGNRELVRPHFTDTFPQRALSLDSYYKSKEHEDDIRSLASSLLADTSQPWRPILTDISERRLSENAKLEAVVLPSDERDQVYDACAQYGVMPHTFLLTCVGLLMAEEYKQLSFVIGAITDTRSDRREYSVVGPYASPLPMLFKLAPESPTFRALLQVTHFSYATALQWKRASLTEVLRLVRESNKDYSLDALFGLTVNYERRHPKSEFSSDAKISCTTVPNPIAKFDFAFAAYDNGASIDLELKYDSSRLSAAKATSIVRKLHHLMTAPNEVAPATIEKLIGCYRNTPSGIETTDTREEPGARIKLYAAQVKENLASQGLESIEVIPVDNENAVLIAGPLAISDIPQLHDTDDLQGQNTSGYLTLFYSKIPSGRLRESEVRRKLVQLRELSLDRAPDITFLWLANEISQLICSGANLPQISLDDNFFVLGGDSLAMTRIALQIQKRYGSHLPIELLLRNFDPRGLAALILSGSSEPPRNMFELKTATI